MRRTGLTPAILLVAFAALMSGCGHASRPTTTRGAATTPSAGSRRLTVSPTHPRPTSAITFAFVAPVGAGRHGKSELAYALLIAGPHRVGCVGIQSAGVSGAVAGHVASVRIGPRELRSDWCPGSYTARVREFARPVCTPGQLCPQYIRVVGTVAAATFEVSTR